MSESLFKNFNELNDNDLILEYSKTKIENEFKRINDYIQSCLYFEQSFFNYAKQIDINSLKKDNLEQYFTDVNSLKDIVVSFISFISFLKENNYIEMQDRVIQAAKVYSPELHIDTVLDYTNINDIFESLMLVRKRYYDNTAPSLDQKETDLIKIVEKYNDFIINSKEDPLTKLLNEVKFSEEFKKSLLVKANNITKEIVGSDKTWTALKEGTESELMSQAKKLIDDYNQKVDILDIINSELIDSLEDIFSYEKAKEAYKKSNKNFGSTEDFLHYLKNTADEIILIRNSIFKLIVYCMLTENTAVVEIVEELFTVHKKDSYREIFKEINNNIENIVGDFIFFAINKNLVWTNEVDLNKTIAKYNKNLELLKLEEVE